MAKKQKARKSGRRNRKKKPGRIRSSGAIMISGVAMEIRSDMSLSKPLKLTASKGDTVFWEITNNFSSAVNVKIKSFKFHDSSIPPLKRVIKFSLQDVDIPAAGFGTIEGTVEHNVRRLKFADLLKYSIVVEDVGKPKGAKDTYDPDLEVLPPVIITVGGRRGPRDPKGRPG